MTAKTSSAISAFYTKITGKVLTLEDLLNKTSGDLIVVPKIVRHDSREYNESTRIDYLAQAKEENVPFLSEQLLYRQFVHNPQELSILNATEETIYLTLETIAQRTLAAYKEKMENRRIIVRFLYYYHIALEERPIRTLAGIEIIRQYV